MATGIMNINATIGSRSIQKAIVETYDHPNTYEEIALAAGKAVADWVKTSASVAAGNLTAGHGYTTGKSDVYWTGGMRYDVDMTVTVNALALSGGSGTDYPASATAGIIICKHQQINTAIDGDNIKLFFANSTQRAHLHFEDAAGAVIKDKELLADQPWTYANSSGETSPLTGNPILVCYVSNGTETAATLDILSGEDSTP